MIFYLINSFNIRNLLYKKYEFFFLRLLCIFLFNVFIFVFVDNEVYRVGYFWFVIVGCNEDDFCIFELIVIWFYI